MISKESYGYNTFEANRIGEIQGTTKHEDWFWISGSDNIANWITRGCAPIKLSKYSTWQNGPEFLKHTEDRWPIKANANTLSINLSKEKIEFNGTVTTNDKLDYHISTMEEKDSLAKRIDINRVSKLQLLLNTTARLFKRYKRFRKNGKKSMKLDISAAETF